MNPINLMAALALVQHPLLKQFSQEYTVLLHVCTCSSPMPMNTVAVLLTTDDTEWLTT